MKIHVRIDQRQSIASGSNAQNSIEIIDIDIPGLENKYQKLLAQILLFSDSRGNDLPIPMLGSLARFQHPYKQFSTYDVSVPKLSEPSRSGLLKSLDHVLEQVEQKRAEAESEITVWAAKPVEKRFYANMINTDGAPLGAVSLALANDIAEFAIAGKITCRELDEKFRKAFGEASLAAEKIREENRQKEAEAEREKSRAKQVERNRIAARNIALQPFLTEEEAAMAAREYLDYDEVIERLDEDALHRIAENVSSVSCTLEIVQQNHISQIYPEKPCSKAQFKFLALLERNLGKPCDYVRVGWKSWTENTGVLATATTQDLRTLSIFIQNKEE